MADSLKAVLLYEPEKSITRLAIGSSEVYMLEDLNQIGDGNGNLAPHCKRYLSVAP